MSDSPDLEAKRLDTQPTELGEQAAELVNEANRAYRTSLKEPRAWDALSERRAKGSGWWMHAVAGLASMATIVWLVQSSETMPEAAVSELQPEPTHVSMAVDAAPQTTQRLDEKREQSNEESQSEAFTKRPQAPPPPAPVSEERCRALATQGKRERAFSCFEKLGHQPGVEGDVAQLERARLALQLGRAQAGFEILEQHKERLAKSALRGEAGQLRVRVLYELGMNQQALQESDAILGAPWGPAAAAEMRWLRGRIYEERLQDCSRAIDEYLTLLGGAGRAADEAEYRRARCLEKVGRSPEARAAYERYLKRAGPRNAEDARAALQRLGH